MLARLHASLVEHADRGGSDGRWVDQVGTEHWLVVPDWDQLRSAVPAAGVGFFGQALAVDHEPISAIETAMLGQLERYPGLLAYYNVRYPWDQWGNLVLFRDRAAIDRLNHEGLHRTAVERSPVHYESLRLHRVSLPTGGLGAAPPQLDETILFDFRDEPTWIAVRPG